MPRGEECGGGLRGVMVHTQTGMQSWTEDVAGGMGKATGVVLRNEGCVRATRGGG